VRVLTNPVVMRALVVLAAAVFSFIVALFFMRRMRQSLSDDAIGKDLPTSIESLPLHTYHAVIQQLKQQKHELQSEQAMERRRAKTSENISSAILSNLSSGVLFFAANGLIRQANAAAKEILGFASPLGMGAAELFRDAALHAHDHDTQSLADEVQSALRDKITFRRLQAHYLTPSGEERILDITLTAVPSPTGEFLGSACLINDQTELAQIRRQQDLRGEMSAEMALELRNSLTTIAGYAQQLAASDDHDLARQLATDISAEAAHLDHTIGGFLAAAKAKAAAQN
jgi:PAS domain S-box-containing protein